MNPKILQMLALQGDIKIRLIKAGLSQSAAHALAGEFIDAVLRSPVATEEYRKAYFELPPWAG